MIWVPVEKVYSNNYNPNNVALVEMRLLYVSILHDGYCVEERTPVLKADMTWVPAGSLRPGDSLIAFDEFATGYGKGRRQRRYRTAQVLSNAVEEHALMRVETDRGAITVTPDHPFLAKRCYGKGHHNAEWIEADDLRPDDTVAHLMEPWSVDRSWEAGWLSGFLDGEGTVAANQVVNRTQQTVRLCGYQQPGPIADRMIKEMSLRAVTKTFTLDRSTHPKWKSMVMARIDRLTEVMRLLGSVRPQRLIDQAGDFWEGAALSGKLKNATTAVVRSVTTAGQGAIARLSTSTQTYIANGFAVHNTQPVVTIRDDANDRWIIVDGFHRYLVMKRHRDIYEKNRGLLPIVVIDKPLNDRMASTIRHNRARGKHSVDGMSRLVLDMLKNGWSDRRVCDELGLEKEELIRLKHVTGYAKFFAAGEYSRAMETTTQINERLKYETGQKPKSA